MSDVPRLSKIVRGNDFNRTVYNGEMRPRLVQDALEYLAQSTNNPYFQQNEVVRSQSYVDIVNLPGLPDDTYAPASQGQPTNFLTLRHPYSQTMPIFFPNCTGDIDDHNRNPKVSESQWLVHMLRSVRKNLSESPLFVFMGAFRLDTQ